MKLRNTARPTNASKTSDCADYWREQLAHIDSLHCAGNLDGLRDLSTKLLRRSKLHEQRTEKLSLVHETVKAECGALVAPEHYKAVITAVSENGSRHVEVAGIGTGRLSISVHPDVASDQLRVGATGWVARERNCLLVVDENAAPWNEIATFEAYLAAGQRILVKHHDDLFALGLADQLNTVHLQQGDLIGFDRDSRLAYERLEPPQDVVLFDDTIEADFDELIGLDQAIAEIKTTLDFRLHYPEVAAAYQLDEKCGVLLYGPAGNGKTHLARCVANYLKQLFPDKPCRFMHVSGSQDYSMWLGQSEQHIIQRFRAAREASKEGRVVIFFDEMDAIGRRRGSDLGSGVADRIQSTFLTQLDGIVQHSNIIVLAATNRPDTLDESLIRPGRFHKKIAIPAPNRRASHAILRHYLDFRPLAAGPESVEQLVAALCGPVFSTNGHLSQVAQVKLSDGRRLPVPGKELLSGALLKNVVNVAAQQAAIRETQTKQRGIREDDLAQALAGELRSIVNLLTPANVKAYVKSIPTDAQPIHVELPPPRHTSHVRS